MNSSTEPQSITLAGGCFWCLEAVYLQVRGMVSVESGYSNGRIMQPSYEEVCTGQTGCAEVVQVQWDPGQLSLQDILEIFFLIHDPTTLNRQGHDVGTQYRSGIYFHDEEQAREVAKFVAALGEQGVYAQPIVTEVLPLADYSAAEAYHQNYYANHPQQGYCAHVVAPKVDKFRRTLARLVRS